MKHLIRRLLLAARRARARRRRRRAATTTTATSVRRHDRRPPSRRRSRSPAGSTMAELQRAGHGAHRHEVRPARASAASTSRPTSPRASTSRSARSSPASSASTRTTSSGSRPISANREAFIQNGTVDFVVATYTINDARKQVVDFAGPYYVAGQDLLVDEGRRLDQRPRRPRRQAGVRGDRLDADRAHPHRATPRRSRSSSTPTPSASTSCRPSQVDAVSTDDIILAGYAADPKYEGEFRVVGETFSEEPYGIGVPKGDDDVPQLHQRHARGGVRGRHLGGGVRRHARRERLEAPEPPAVDRY